MRDSTALPDLHMLPTATLVPHEDYDPRRIEKLSQRLQGEGILKNPPIATAIPGDYALCGARWSKPGHLFCAGWVFRILWRSL